MIFLHQMIWLAWPKDIVILCWSSNKEEEEIQTFFCLMATTKLLDDIPSIYFELRYTMTTNKYLFLSLENVILILNVILNEIVIGDPYDPGFGHFDLP